jgi:hypothetical protein
VERDAVVRETGLDEERGVGKEEADDIVDRYVERERDLGVDREDVDRELDGIEREGLDG